MAVITTRHPPKIRLPPERYYLIIKSIQAGYGRSNFYQQKVTNDPRPIQSLIVRLSGMGPERVISDLKYLVNNRLVRCYVDEGKKHVFSSPRRKKKNRPIRTYEATEKGLQYVADYDGNKISYQQEELSNREDS